MITVGLLFDAAEPPVGYQRTRPKAKSWRLGREAVEFSAMFAKAEVDWPMVIGLDARNEEGMLLMCAPFGYPVRVPFNCHCEVEQIWIPKIYLSPLKEWHEIEQAYR